MEHPSTEGMPLVPMEAAEAAVPVAASAIDTHEELYERAPEALARWFADYERLYRAVRREG